METDYEYFRTDKVPCAGHFIRDTEKFENKLYLLKKQNQYILN